MDTTEDGTEIALVTEEVEGCFTYTVPAPPKKKKKIKGQGENGEKTRKPRTAYLLYYYDTHLKVQQEFPHLPQSEINKKISESWKCLSVAEKGYYLEKAKLEREGIDPNTRLSGPLALAVDVPGFRKILPRSDYLIISKSTLEDLESGKKPLDLHAAQTPGALEGSATPQTFTQDAVQGLFSASRGLAGEAGHITISEQCVAIEGLAEDAAFSHSGAIQEIVSSEILSQYAGSAVDKVAADIIMDEAAALELAVGTPYQTTSLVIEEAVVSSTGGITENTATACQQGAEDGTAVMTVITDQETEESSLTNTSTQFIMLSLPALPIETTPSIKLAATYTRRGRGSCNNPSCSFTYVTRHKPPKCPKCGQHLGGKWVPKGKGTESLKAQTQLNASNTGTAQSQDADLNSNASMREAPGSALENCTAVCQLLNVTPLAEGEGQRLAQREGAALGADAASDPACALCLKEERAPPPITERKGGGQCLNSARGVTARDSLVVKKEELDCSGGSRDPPKMPIQKTSSWVPLSAAVSFKHQDMRSKGRDKPSLLAAGRPVRAILPAPANPGAELEAACYQWIAFPVETQKSSEVMKLVSTEKQIVSRTSGLKPSTLKQLGHTFRQTADTNQPKVGLRSTNGESPSTTLDIKAAAFPSIKSSRMTTFDLGLATSRGKGKCKNPGCSYIYTNRHKPRACPQCGRDLAKEKADKPLVMLCPLPEMPSILLDPHVPLTPSQKEVQRQSTLQLLRKTMQIPESEADLADVFALIQDLNSSRFVLSSLNEEMITIEQSSWASYYESSAVQCCLCDSPLFKGTKNSLAGPEDCWLLTDTHVQVVTSQVNVCLNPQCLALHSFNDINSGLFNVGNKLLVSLDLLFRIRNQIRQGNDPREAACDMLDSVLKQTEKSLNSTETGQLQELLCTGYWAFECLTIRDYNDMICGICGVAPKVEIAQRNTENTLALKNVEFTWPDFLTSDEVNVDDFWLTMETEAIEQAAFPSSIPITKFDTSIIAPFIPPLMRGSVVVNTEKDKNPALQPAPGNGSALVRLLHEDTFKPDQISCYSKEELRQLVSLCGIPSCPEQTKEDLCYSLLALYETVQNGFGGVGASQPPPHQTGGKIYKVCPHQVVCGSKYLVRGECARDHVDLLVSSRHWPPVYVVDTATQVALTADIWYPDLTAQMWGKTQGCFSDPMKPPKSVSCPELLDQHYSMDVTLAENSVQHPVTRTSARRIVHAEKETGELLDSDPTYQHHSIFLCQELEPYGATIAAFGDSRTHAARQRAVAFENATYYYLYNRLVDFLTSRDIVNRQISDVVLSCQPGEVVIRDALYRLGVAQINTVGEMEEEELVQ
ncbi:HMG domain-containing protein 3 [Latimeria chalumnae]|uniref:HMG domain-containing protein 3 n=1 Tax=Latimeria chalumnae TaxID=7897 RepID=UPI0003C1A656|nr:PREDICTED: HMG domain-containing protein 3 isoform X2 [Latimeria chalumnae]XP_014351465.1 PREDICTED: HMG domain-containing protein 3 isoform X2 [Latimeria chalumnae]|eukprot:XP_005988335.1 PREDICTED: HMG domain-containing protein 3 isoform X2 [Latimeria chalumnae]